MIAAPASIITAERAAAPPVAGLVLSAAEDVDELLLAPDDAAEEAAELEAAPELAAVPRI